MWEKKHDDQVLVPRTFAQARGTFRFVARLLLGRWDPVRDFPASHMEVPDAIKHIIKSSTLIILHWWPMTQQE